MAQFFDPMMMQQQYLYQNSKKEQEDYDKFLNELYKFTTIDNLEDAKSLAYKQYPKFKDNISFIESGIVMTKFESENQFRIIAELPHDKVICYDYTK